MSPKKTPAPTSTPVKKDKKVPIQTVVLGVLFFGLVLQFFQVMSLQRRVDELSPGAESGSALSDMFGQGEEEADEEALSTLLFDFVSTLGAYEENKARYESNLTALQASMKENFWMEDGLNLQNPNGTYTEEDLDYIFSEMSDSYYPGHPVFTVSLSYDGTLAVDAYGEELELSDEFSVESSMTEFKAYIKEELTDLRAHIQTVNAARSVLNEFITGAEFQAVLVQKGLKSIPEAEQNGSYLFAFQNSEALPVAECRVLKEDASFVCSTLAPVSEVSGAPFEDVKDEILTLFTELDARTALQKKLDEQKAMINEVLEDPAFQAALGNAHLSLGAAIETETALQYPILNEAGETLRLLILDKATGEVKVSHPDGQETRSLSAEVQLLEFSSKKKLWTSPVSFRTMLS